MLPVIVTNEINVIENNKLSLIAKEKKLICVPNTKIENCREWWKLENWTYIVTWVEVTWDSKENIWNKASICDFICSDGYHKSWETCVRNSWNGWWWWGGSSWGGKITNDEVIELGWQVSDKCSVSWSNLSQEIIDAYLYACENDITTIRDINEARLGDFLTRAEMAKIVSVFATKELWMKPNTSKDCSNFANSISEYNQEMKDFMVMSCQLELMWIHTVDYKAIPDFMPNKRVSRAEFWTILSRMLWWNTYEWTNSNYYFKHLDALKSNNIITNVDPNITEYRSWVLLMIYRSVNVIRSWKAKTNESVEESVNEKLEEGSGSFVWLANPASAYCVEQWWESYNLKDSEWNEVWMCKLEDWTLIDEREYYRNNNKDESSVKTWTTVEVEADATENETGSVNTWDVNS